MVSLPKNIFLFPIVSSIDKDIMQPDGKSVRNVTRLTSRPLFLYDGYEEGNDNNSNLSHLICYILYIMRYWKMM